MQIIRAEQGDAQQTIELSKINIPDLWHIAMAETNEAIKNKILTTWYLCHDLKLALEKIDASGKFTEPVHTNSYPDTVDEINASLRPEESGRLVGMYRGFKIILKPMTIGDDKFHVYLYDQRKGMEQDYGQVSDRTLSKRAAVLKAVNVATTIMSVDTSDEDA